MSDSADSATDTVPAVHYAALLVAIGWLRGALYGVQSGEIDRAHLRRLLDATSTAAIAEAIGLTEDDLIVDVERYLSTGQKRAIGGEGGF